MEMILMVISLQVIRRKIGSLPMIQKKLQGLLRILKRRSLSSVKRIGDSKYAEGLSPQACGPGLWSSFISPVFLG